MKRKMKNSIAIALTVLLSVMTFVPTAHGQPPQRFRADLGVLTPAVGQTLRVTVAGNAGNDAIRVRLRWMQYAPQGCSGMPPVCRHMVVSQGATPVETLGPDDALSVDVQGSGEGARVIVESNSRNARVVAQIIDIATGKVVSVVAARFNDGDPIAQF